MKTIKTIIVDDERPSREILRSYLRKYFPDIEIAASMDSVKAAVSAISNHKPDLVFLDIELPDGKGFDILQKFSKEEFKVVFVTAYTDYAVKAFRFSAVDYLLKPVRIDELKEAIQKVREMDGTTVNSERIDILMRHLQTQGQMAEKLVISSLKGYEVLKLPEIIMCRADGYCTNFFLTGNRKTGSSRNLKTYERMLTEHGFMRTHHSFIVNLNHVTGYTRQGEILLSEGNKAFLSNSYKERFMSVLLKYQK